MACDLGFDFNFAPAFLGSTRMDRQGLPVSQVGRREDSELLAKLAAQLRVDPRGKVDDSAQSSWVHDKGRGIEREQPSQQHYVSRASTSAADGLGSGPSEGEQCNESQEAVNDEEEEGRDSEGEGRPSKTRDKNRRAQQRFRQRQKAKLQAKEQETLQLQKQVQDMQAQLLSFQMSGASPLYKQQLEQVQSRCQALQAENNEIRTLAMLYMDENARLHADRKQQLLPLASQLLGSSPHDTRLQHLLMQKQLLQQTAPLSLPFGRQIEPSWLAAFKAAETSDVSVPRLTVFKNLHQIPWQVAPSSLPEGLPAGISPGHTQARILFKMLSRAGDGSTTVLIKFPPGFVHDYVVCSEVQTEEGIILEGSMTDTVRNEAFHCGDYCRILPGHQHGPYRADSAEGALCFVVTRKTRI